MSIDLMKREYRPITSANRYAWEWNGEIIHKQYSLVFFSRTDLCATHKDRARCGQPSQAVTDCIPTLVQCAIAKVVHDLIAPLFWYITSNLLRSSIMCTACLLLAVAACSFAILPHSVGPTPFIAWWLVCIHFAAPL